MNSTKPEQEINPAAAARQTEAPEAGPTPAAAGPSAEATPPVRRIVRLDAEYLSAGPHPSAPPRETEPEDEQLIVLPRRWGSVGVLPRLLYRLFRAWLS